MSSTISSSTLKFLKNLKANNEKTWFDAHRKEYDAAKQNVEEVSAEILKHLTEYHSLFSEMLPKNCMFRINRDVRFSKNKDPYKTNIGVYFNPLGKKSDTPGFYLHIEPGKSFAAAGVWMPEKNYLANIRQEIDYNFKEFNKIIQQKSFKNIFANGFSKNESLQRPPKGYEENNPAIEFIKMKSFVVTTPISDKVLQDNNFVKTIMKIFQTAYPLNRFLEKAVGE